MCTEPPDKGTFPRKMPNMQNPQRGKTCLRIFSSIMTFAVKPINCYLQAMPADNPARSVGGNRYAALCPVSFPSLYILYMPLSFGKPATVVSTPVNLCKPKERMPSLTCKGGAGEGFAVAVTAFVKPNAQRYCLKRGLVLRIGTQKLRYTDNPLSRRSRQLPLPRGASSPLNNNLHVYQENTHRS